MSKVIYWTSWNAMSDEYIGGISEEMSRIEESLYSSQNELDSGISSPIIERAGMDMIQTPFGVYPLESMFKPSDRWDCWIGTTNFDVTKSIKKTLKKNVSGIEALRVLGRYTFCIGVPMTFEFSTVRAEIEGKLCAYTKDEVLDAETNITVELLKAEISEKKHWSILVTSDKEIDYIVSDDLDSKYLDGLNKLLELRKALGGIILRGTDG